MTEPKPTIGRAIDDIVSSLGPFDEPDKRTILLTVCSHLKIELEQHEPRLGPAATILNPPRSDSPAEATKHGMASNMDIKSLKEQKKPSSARQMACLVAYYLQEHAPENERKKSITSADIEKYFKQAGYKLPEKLEQLLADSKRSGYFESESRGAYKLTRVGYNLVAHSLPSREQA